MQITYKNKVTLQSNPNIPDENKVTAEDMNEIKSVVNSNEEEQQALNLSVQEIAQNVEENNQDISDIKAEQTTQNNRLSSLESDNTENKANIQENANNINQLSRRVQTNETNIALLQLESGNTLELSLNNTTYELTATLKNKAGTTLSTSKVDFPVEQLVISVTYDSAKKELVITLKNGQVTRVPIGSIINGLVNQSDFDALVQTVQTKANQSDLDQTNTNVTNLAGRVSNNESKIENIEQEQTTQNTNISTNATNIESLQEENENLKKIVSQLPQVEGQGTSITLENTIEAQFTKFDVEGNSTQETTEGYNQLNLEKYPYSESSSALNGGTVTIKDGVITLNATNATGNMTALSVTKIATADSIEAGTYYFGVDVYGAYESTPSTNIWEYRGNRTLTEKFIMKQWKFAVTQGNVASTPILVSNDTSKTTYEPYTNGASPNPSYEQPIYSAGDNENEFNPELAEDKKYQNIDGNYSIATHPLTWISGLQSIESSQSYILNYQAQTGAFYDENRNVIKSSPIYQSNTFQTPSNAKYVNLTFAPSIVTFDDKDNIKLEKGNKASGYSPYGMGSITEKIVNRNWLIWELPYTVSTASNIILSNIPELEVGENYYFVGKCSDGTELNSSNCACVWHEGNTQLLNKNPKVTFTGIDISSATGFYIYVTSALIGKTISEFMLVKGTYDSSNVPDYVPHKEQDYPIFVQQPMRSIGDVRDLFFKNTVDSPYYDENLTLNGWYERHYIGEKILNGTENWEIYNTHIYLYDNTFKASVESNDYVPNYKCNYFMPDSLFNANSNPNGKILQNVWGALANHKGIAFNSQDAFSDVATLKTWLSTHNVVVQYELAEPLDLPCTETQIQQLENKPSTYKDFTIINSEDETPAYLEVSGIYDMNKLITRVEVIESEV